MEKKKDMKTCAWRYITFSVAYDYVVWFVFIDSKQELFRSCS